MKNKRGIIKISSSFIKDIDNGKDILFKILSEFIPIKIEDNSAWNNEIIYYGYSDKFDFILQGEVIPVYDVSINIVDGDFILKFNRLS